MKHAFASPVGYRREPRDASRCLHPRVLAQSLPYVRRQLLNRRRWTRTSWEPSPISRASLRESCFWCLIPISQTPSFVSMHFNRFFLMSPGVAFWMIWMILSAVLTPLTAGIFGVIALPLMLIFTVAGFGIWAFLMCQAYQQKLFKL